VRLPVRDIGVYGKLLCHFFARLLAVLALNVETLTNPRDFRVAAIPLRYDHNQTVMTGTPSPEKPKESDD
jgi:hypothetical protein